VIKDAGHLLFSMLVNEIENILQDLYLNGFIILYLQNSWCFSMFAIFP